MSLSDLRTFGLQNLQNEEPLIRTHEPSDYRTFGLESSHRYKTILHRLVFFYKAVTMEHIFGLLRPANKCL